MSALNGLRAIFACALLASASAHAGLFRVYLASTGSDSNPCNLPQPCRLLPAALTAVADGGEIWMLDSANYNTGTVTIDKSVSIIAIPGAVGSILAMNAGPAISISAAGLNIALRNVVLGPFAGLAAASGVQMTGASTLVIEGSVIADLPTSASGVFVQGGGTVMITNTVLRNNGGYAIDARDGATVVIGSSQMLGNASGGISAGSASAATTLATVTNCAISGGSYGIKAETTGVGAVARISVRGTTVESVPGYALLSSSALGGASEINIGGSMIVNNAYSWAVAGGGSTILSLGNNQVSGNANFSGALSTLAPQ
jgi:parallel beta helix pectate lyase-like protein